MHSCSGFGGRTGHDITDSGNLRCGDTHDRRSNMGVATSGDITSGGFYRNQPLSAKKSRSNFRLEFGHTCTLLFCEKTHPFISKADIVFELYRNFARCVRNFFRSHNDVSCVIVEIFGIFTHLVFASTFNGIQHFRDDATCVFFTSLRIFGCFF